MGPFLLWAFLGLYSSVQAVQSVSVESDPRYRALPFCAQDCLWNDNNVGDVASNISFIFPCYNSCYCSPDTVQDALDFLSQCITSSPCCDVTDYINAISLYYSYCNANEPWSMPLPSEIGTTPPSPTTRTTSLSTASWCSTAHFSPTSTASTTSTTSSRTAGMTSTQAPTATAVASDSGTDSGPNSNLARILIPCISVGVGLIILSLCWWMCCHTVRASRRERKAMLSGPPPDSTPLIVIPHSPILRPSTAWSSQENIVLVVQVGNEGDVGAKGGKNVTAPPPYSP